MDKLTSPGPTSSIKYKGVRLRKWGKYVSEIRLPNSRERIWLGSYDTAEKAARAFDAAQFCLRGLVAKFNFPDDPPRIAAGQGRSPAEIQSLAQQHGNSYRPPERAPEGTSNPEGAAGSIDWSFLDMLGNDAGCDPDFGLFHEPGDMHMPPHYDHDSSLDEDSNYEHGNDGNGQSFLWNF